MLFVRVKNDSYYTNFYILLVYNLNVVTISIFVLEITTTDNYYT